MLKRLFGFFSHDIGIDLGTANTLVFVLGKGITIREPSVIARHKKSKEILAIGTGAKKMLGRAPGLIEVVRPLQDGVIADFDATHAMLMHYIRRVHESQNVIPKIPRPKVVVGIPSGVTEVERRAVADAAISSGARQAYLIEEPIAAALGAGVDIEEASGNFVVDIGGGTSEIALISLGGVVVGKSVRVAGDEMDEAIVNYVRLKYSVLLGQPTAENIKITIGSAHPGPEKAMIIRGRDLEKGLPKSIRITSNEIREALSPILQDIIMNIKETLEEAPPELVADVAEKGILLAGGGALLTGIDKAIGEAVKMPVHVADDALSCVARGCGRVLSQEQLLKKISVVSGL